MTEQIHTLQVIFLGFVTTMLRHNHPGKIESLAIARPNTTIPYFQDHIKSHGFKQSLVRRCCWTARKLNQCRISAIYHLVRTNLNRVPCHRNAGGMLEKPKTGMVGHNRCIMELVQMHNKRGFLLSVKTARHGPVVSLVHGGCRCHDASAWRSMNHQLRHKGLTRRLGPLPLHRFLIDFLAGLGHKGLAAPQGSVCPCQHTHQA